MSRDRQPGPLDSYSRHPRIEDGTLLRLASPQPGPRCADGGVQDYARRAVNVRDAFLLAVREYALSETRQHLDEDLHALVDSIWPGFVDALTWYAWGAGGGAVLFGAVGGYFGGGVGAVPGALFGAKLGSGVVTTVLLFLGLKFLAQYVLAHLSEASRHLRAGVRLAWEVCGPLPQLEPAAREFARMIATLFGLLLQAVAVWVLHKGLRAGLESLNRSRVGRALAPYAKVQYYRQKIGVSDAPIPRNGIGTAVRFFEEEHAAGRLPAKTMGEGNLIGYLRGMDFSKEVAVETLPPGRTLIAYRDPNPGPRVVGGPPAEPFGYFYADSGAAMDTLGVGNPVLRTLPEGVQGPRELVNRGFIRYQVVEPVRVLRSSSSGVRVGTDGLPTHITDVVTPQLKEHLKTLGGGKTALEEVFTSDRNLVPDSPPRFGVGGSTQYFIPNASKALRVTDNPAGRN